MSDFAKAQLLKYGWSEGKGLGRKENGIAEPLKPKLKFDTTGVGHKDNEFHWWDSVYDKALKNIVLEKNSDAVSISVAKENAFNISSSKINIDGAKKKHKLQYGNFLKTSTLENGNMVKDETCEVLEEENMDNPTEIKMTDEELFKACGGRTAHKGARHGLTLCGKLARIAEQEKQLLANGYLNSNEKPECNEIKKKKKKKRKRDMEVEDCTTNVNNDDHYLDDDDCLKLPPLKEDYKPSKKTRLKAARKVNDLVNQLSKSWSINDDSAMVETIPPVQNTEEAMAETDDQNLKIKKKEKKKKSKRKREQELIVIDNNISTESSKKKKKRKIEEISSLEENDIDTNDIKNMYESINIDVNRLNDKIIRKKQRKYEQKVKKRLDQLSKSLLAVNLDTSEESIESTTSCVKNLLAVHLDTADESIENTTSSAKKKRKKEKKNSVYSVHLDTAPTDKAIETTTNCAKKKRKKEKKHKKEKETYSNNLPN